MSINTVEIPAVRKIRKRNQRKALEEIEAQEVVAPTGKYDVIVIDPPWPMERIKRNMEPVTLVAQGFRSTVCHLPRHLNLSRMLRQNVAAISAQIVRLKSTNRLKTGLSDGPTRKDFKSTDGVK